jgi:hypothetical protein
MAGRFRAALAWRLSSVTTSWMGPECSSSGVPFKRRSRPLNLKVIRCLA